MTPALREGPTTVRVAGTKPGLFAVSRFDPATGREVVLAFNTASEPVTGAVEVAGASLAFTALAGDCPAAPAAPGSLTLALPPFGYAVCAARPR